jgi:hypothetical protein
LLLDEDLGLLLDEDLGLLLDLGLVLVFGLTKVMLLYTFSSSQGMMRPFSFSSA